MKREHKKIITTFGWTFINTLCDCGIDRGYYLTTNNKIYRTIKQIEMEDSTGRAKR